jgi:hypothetical protein
VFSEGFEEGSFRQESLFITAKQPCACANDGQFVLLPDDGGILSREYFAERVVDLGVNIFQDVTLFFGTEFLELRGDGIFANNFCDEAHGNAPSSIEMSWQRTGIDPLQSSYHSRRRIQRLWQMREPVHGFAR